MSNAVYYVSYKLKKGKEISDFLLATEKLSNEIKSKHKGFVSWKQLLDGNTWADFATFETMEDLNKFKEASKKPSDTAKEFYSFINLFSCKQHIFSVEKTHS